MSLLDMIATAKNIQPEDISAGIMLYGPSGSGKTHTASMGGKPLILLLERNGLTTIIRANPEADVINVSTVDQIRDAIRLAKDGTLQKKGYDRLVIDSLTELQRFFKDDIQKSKEGGQDGTFSQQDWGLLTEKMRRFMRTLRSLPISVVCTALADEVNETQNGMPITRMRPSFEGRKTPAEVAQYFNAVGFVAKRDIDGEAQHRVMFDGPSRYVTKSCGVVISGLVEPNITRWLSVIADPSKDINPVEAEPKK